MANSLIRKLNLLNKFDWFIYTQLIYKERFIKKTTLKISLNSKNTEPQNFKSKKSELFTTVFM